MIGHQRQARNLIFFLALFLVLSAPVVAKTHYSSTGTTQDSGGAEGAGGNKVLSVGDVFTRLGDAVARLVPFGGRDGDDQDSTPTKKPTSEDKSADSKTQKADESTPGKTDEPKMIKAKRLDAPEDEGAKAKVETKEEPAAPPYKVYAAPMIPDEEEPAPRAATHRPTRVSAVENGTTFDTKQPPPLDVNDMKENLEDYLVGSAPVSHTAQQVNSSRSETSRNDTSAASVTSIPKQFFPIFPFSGSQDSQEQLLPIASNRALEEDQSDISRAIIVVHDIQRNSVESIATLMTLNGTGGEPTLLIAPTFSLDIDIARFEKNLPDRGERVARWTMESPWQFGGESSLGARQRGISSFTAMDILLLFLSDHQRFPSLRQVVIVGHGMVADFVQRYAALGQAPDVLMKERVPVRFVVANPSSYMYLTHVRPSDTGRRFVPPDKKACASVDDYPYGLQNLPSYAKRTGANAVKMRYPERNVVYLVGDKMQGDHFLAQGCEAAAQGKTRTDRSQSFGAYIEQSFGEDAERTQHFVGVRGAGYDPVMLYGSSCGMAALFGDGTCR